MSRSSRHILRRTAAVALALPLLVASGVGAQASDAASFGSYLESSVEGQVEAQSPIDQVCEKVPWVPFCQARK